jgi:MATE family multidrug resistance protein
VKRIPASLRIEHGREIFIIAAPTVLTMLSQTLMWTVDVAFLGHVSSLALAAAGLGGMITWTGYSIFNNLSRVTATFVSQANGEGNDARAAAYAWQGIYVAILAGAFLTLAGWHAGRFLPLVGLPHELEQQTAVFIRYRSLSAIGTQLSLTLGGFHQGRKDVRKPMYAGIAANALNLALDYLLIFGWNGVSILGRHHFGTAPLGVKGAALATTSAVWLNALLLAGPLLLSPSIRRRYRMHVPRQPEIQAMRDLVRIGLPSSIDTFADMLAFALFSSFIGRTGAVALATSQITIQLLSFSFMPMWGITTAATVLVGNLIGARDLARAARYAREILVVGTGYVLLLAALLALFGDRLYAIFTRDPEVLRAAGSMALLAAIFQVFDGMRMLVLGILQGAGDTRYPMWVSVGVLYGLFVPLSAWLSIGLHRGVAEIWIAGCVAYALIATGLFLRYRAGRWKEIRIFSEAAGTVNAPS